MNPEINILGSEMDWYIGPLFFKLSHNYSTPLIGELRVQQVRNIGYCGNGNTVEIVLFTIMSSFIGILMASILYIGYRYRTIRNMHQNQHQEDGPPIKIKRYQVSLTTKKVKNLENTEYLDEIDESARLFPLSFNSYGGAHSISFLIKRPTNSQKLHEKISIGRLAWADKRYIGKYEKI
eukprot:NODE_758_length_4157_cov_0.859044.p3 type:complete len:179 gc:universal NODE_758_length_4157_cov_0.859044:2795-2259(-)